MYIKNKDLLEEVKKYKETKIISEKLHLLIYQLTINIASKPNWSGYSWKEDMQSDAYVKCLDRLDKFDPEKSSNAFGFFTTVVFNFFIDTIKKFHYHKGVIDKLESQYKKKLEMEFNVNFDKMQQVYDK